MSKDQYQRANYSENYTYMHQVLLKSNSKPNNLSKSPSLSLNGNLKRY